MPPNACATCPGSRSSNPLAADGWAAGPSSPRIPSRSSKRRISGSARLALARLDGSDPVRVGDGDADPPPFLGGLVGYLGYGLRTVLEPRLAASAAAHPRPASRLPDLHLALHDWVVAWDEWSGAAWIGGRAVDGDAARLAARLTDARARLADVVPVPVRPPPSLAPVPLLAGSPRVRGGSRGRSRRDRTRRDLPGQPHSPPRHPVQR